ncbi:hypothetical protein NHP164001_02760 [Helicobacter trogontum]|uniref:BPTI/Kunitz inhibitor domain-containing protein n=1 Tax=Helicobacter trogontum TaxID=50960 RepID=A0ABQ0D1S2_9HELI
MKTAKNHKCFQYEYGGGADFEACQKECGNYQGSNKYKHDKQRYSRHISSSRSLL